MSLGHLVVIFILRHHWQSEIDCRGGNECISKFDGSMYAIAATIENEAGQAVMTDSLMGSGTIVRANAKVPARFPRDALSAATRHQVQVRQLSPLTR